MLMLEEEVELQGIHCRIVMEGWVGGRNALRRPGGVKEMVRGVLMQQRGLNSGAGLPFSG